MKSPIRQQDSHLAQLAEEIFFRYGGEPHYEVIAPKTQYGGMFEMSGPISSPDINYSASHNAIYMFISRVIKPVWKYTIVRYTKGKKN